MVKWDSVHVGKHRQAISGEEAQAQADAGLTPGITPDLHAPEISPPHMESETNLHGDVAGSPYSDSPGEISLKQAAEQDKANASQPRADAAGTRGREIESRVTGIDTETLAAEDEAEGDGPKPKPSKAKR